MLSRYQILGSAGAAILMVSTPACASTNRLRVLRGVAGTPTPTPTPTPTAFFGEKTPAGYGALDLGHATAVGDLTIVAGTEKDGNGTATSVLVMGTSAASASVANRLIPTGTYAAGNHAAVTQPLIGVASPITLDTTDGVTVWHESIAIVPNTWSFRSDERDGVTAFQLRNVFYHAPVGDTLSQRCGAGNPNALKQGGFAESIEAHGFDAAFTGSNWTTWQPDSPGCATWTNIRFSLEDSVYLKIKDMIFHLDAYTGGWAQDGSVSIQTPLIYASGISDLRVENSDFSSNTSGHVCDPMGPFDATCVDNDLGGNIYSGIQTHDTFANRGSNIQLYNNSFHGLFEGWYGETDNAQIVGNNFYDFYEDALNSGCLTNYQIKWNNFYSRKEGNGGGHGDWGQFTDSSCPAGSTQVAGSIIGNRFVDGVGSDKAGGQGEGNGFPYMGGGHGNALWTGLVMRGNFLSFNGTWAAGLVDTKDFDFSYNTIVQDQGGAVTLGVMPPILKLSDIVGGATGGVMKCNVVVGQVYANYSGTQTPTTTENVVLDPTNYAAAFVSPLFGATAITGGVAGMQAGFTAKAGGPLAKATTGYSCTPGAADNVDFVHRVDNTPP